MTTATRWAPNRAELDEITARTARANANPDMSPGDRMRMAELEERAHQQHLTRPGADAAMQRDAERTERAYQIAHPAPVGFLGAQRELEAGS